MILQISLELYNLFISIHSILMTIGLLFFMGGGLISRIFKRKAWWYRTHHYMVYIGFTLMVIASIISFTTVELRAGTHFRVLHPYFAAVTEILLVISLIGGPGLIKALNEYTKKLRRWHRIITHITIILMIVTIIVGIYSLLVII